MFSTSEKVRSRFQESSRKSSLDVLSSLLEFRDSGNRRVLQTRYVKVLNLRAELFNLLGDLAQYMEVGLVRPENNPAPAGMSPESFAGWIREDNRIWTGEVLEQMKSDRIGRVEHTSDETLRYNFFEVNRRKGFWNHKVNRAETTHEVSCPHYVRLPAAGVEMPQKAQDMVSRIMKEDHKIIRHFSIITGQLTSYKTEIVEEWREGSSINKATMRVTKGVRNNAGKLAAGAGLFGLGAAALSAASSVGPVAATAAAVVDPALVLGKNLCFFGWK